MTTAERESPEKLFGVSLADLARVHAAARAGVPLEERLAEMAIDRTAFSRAEQAWSDRLAISLQEEPALFVAYDSALAEALASDAPKIVPLEDEVAAWVSFEGHFQRAADPAALARQVGLTLSEVARLHRSWAARLAEDEALAAEALKARAAEPAPLPEIRREPRRAVMVNRLRGAGEASRGASAPQVGSGAQVGSVPSTAVPSQVGSVPSTAVPSQVGSVPSTVVPPQVGSVRSTVVPPQVGSVPSMAVPSQLSSPPSYAIPGQASGVPSFVAAAQGAGAAGAAPRIGGTILDIGAALPAPAVPFAQGGSSEEAIARAKEQASQSPSKAPSVEAPIGETTGVDIAALARKVLAFGPPKPLGTSAATPPAVASSPPVAPSLAVAPPAPVAKRTDFSSETVQSVPLPKGPALPFAARAPEPAQTPAQAPVQTPSYAPPPGLTLSVDDYAAISAELSLYPENRPVIWARYGVRDAAAAGAITAQWNARLSADPAIRQTWQTAYAAHRARLGGPRR